MTGEAMGKRSVAAKKRGCEAGARVADTVGQLALLVARAPHQLAPGPSEALLLGWVCGMVRLVYANCRLAVDPQAASRTRLRSASVLFGLHAITAVAWRRIHQPLCSRHRGHLPSDAAPTRHDEPTRG